jgi:SAM-dependent methyltransferase
MAADRSVTDLNRLNAARRPGRTLVVGSKCYGNKLDRRSLYENAVGVDLFEGEGVDLVHDLETPLPASLGLFDHVDCVSVLEHVRRPWLLCANVEAVMCEGATILVQVPFVWRLHAYPGDYWRITHEGLEVLFPSVEWSERRYLVDARLTRKVPTFNDMYGGRWHKRSETAAFGTKCTSTS